MIFEKGLNRTYFLNLKGQSLQNHEILPEMKKKWILKLIVNFGCILINRVRF